MKDIETIRRMMRQMSVILNKKQKKQIAGIFIVILFGSVLELLGVSALLPFIQAIMAPEELLKNNYVACFVGVFGIHGNMQLIVWLGCGLVLLYLFKNVYLIWSSYLQCSFSCNTQKELSVMMLRSYLNRPYSFFVNHNSGEILRGVSGDAGGIYSVIFYFFKFLSEILVVISISIYLIKTDAGMAFGVVISGLICLIIIVFSLKRKISQMGYTARDANTITNKWVNEAVSGAKDVYVYKKNVFFIRNYERAFEDGAKASAMYNFASGCPERIIEAVCAIGIIITVVIKLGTGTEAESFVPKLAVFAMGAFRMMPCISRVASDISIFIFQRPSVESAYTNVTEARRYISEIESRTDSELEKNNVTFMDKVIIEDIVWRYDNSERNVLDGLSMTIHRGEAIGIIGESGSGKSTLSDILLHLYRPLDGRIMMDDIDINTIPVSWNKCIGYVPQMVFLMDGPVRSNVAFGEDNIDDDRVWDALDRARLKEYVESLPDGLDTIVGERGIKFSGGQRQRIAIARALYNKPQILVLDEATSALDNDTEKAVMDAIDNLYGEVTLIIIAHRLTTIANCDRIYEIADGKARERDKDQVLKAIKDEEDE